MDEKNYSLAVQLRRELHEHPELSNEESWTKEHLISFLKTHTKNIEIVDKGNWFYGKYYVDEGKKNIAFRADFDALPMDEVIDLPWASRFEGKAHKCGHDGHSATLAALALEVDQTGADKNVFFLFQHAEETGDGAFECKEFIKEEQIDEIYAYHNMSELPYNSVAIKDGTLLCASKGMTIYLEGKAAHASHPEHGRNPSLSIANIVKELPYFTSAEINKGLIQSTIVQIDVGEKAFGIAASRGALRMTIRALYEDELDTLQKNIEDFAKEQAKENGLEVTFGYTDVFPETVNEEGCANNIRQVARDQGFELIEFDEAYRGSEDFGHYTKLTKGAYCMIGNGEDYPNVHTSEYDFRDELIKTGVELFQGLIELP